MYSYQNSLPRMPVPPLKDTVQGFLKSVKHLLDRSEYNEMEALAKVRVSVSSNKYSFVFCIIYIYLLSIHTTLEVFFKMGTIEMFFS